MPWLVERDRKAHYSAAAYFNGFLIVIPNLKKGKKWKIKLIQKKIQLLKSTKMY